MLKEQKDLILKTGKKPKQVPLPPPVLREIDYSSNYSSRLSQKHNIPDKHIPTNEGKFRMVSPKEESLIEFTGSFSFE